MTEGERVVAAVGMLDRAVEERDRLRAQVEDLRRLADISEQSRVDAWQQHDKAMSTIAEQAQPGWEALHDEMEERGRRIAALEQAITRALRLLISDEPYAGDPVADAAAILDAALAGTKEQG